MAAAAARPMNIHAMTLTPTTYDDRNQCTIQYLRPSITPQVAVPNTTPRSWTCACSRASYTCRNYPSHHHHHATPHNTTQHHHATPHHTTHLHAGMTDAQGGEACWGAAVVPVSVHQQHRCPPHRLTHANHLRPSPHTTPHVTPHHTTHPTCQGSAISCSTQSISMGRYARCAGRAMHVVPLS